MRVTRFIVSALLLMTCFVSIQAQEMPQMPPLPVDKAVVTGKLDNGLTYYVRHNDYPEHRVNFYIAQRVGSIQEEESQRGLAHFLEHMAFNGTENYPGNGIIEYTRSLGVEFGRDLNAYTSVDQTVYNINDVPSTRQASLDSCLLILKDWSNGLLLEDEEIDKERGVIHEEWRLRSSAGQRMFERNLETLYPGSKYGKRMPIGLMDVVDNFKYNEIRDYYHKWYRPDNQAIVIVGDVDVDYTVAKIKELFGPIPAPAPDAAQVVDEEVPDNDEAIVVVDKDKEMNANMVEIMVKQDPFPEELKSNMLYALTRYMVDMATTMLDKRLDEKAQDPDCPFIRAGAGYGEYIYAKTKDCFELNVMPKEGKDEEAVKLVTEEALRAAKFGFTATEYSRARDEYLSNIEKRYNNRNQTYNETFGRLYCANYLSKEPMVSIEDEYTLANQVAPMIPVEAINQLLPEFMPEDNKNVVIMSLNKDVEGNYIPTNESLLTAFNDAHKTELEAYVDNVKDEPLITEMPKRGKIKKVTENKQLGYKELQLSNGARVIVKKTDFKDDEILMQAESKGGSSLYGESDWMNLTLFDPIISMSGLGNFDSQELEKALAGKNANVDLSLSTSYERLSGNSTVKDLETMFQLNYLYFTNIKKDEKSFNMLMNMLEMQLKNKVTPEAVFSDSLQVTRSNHSWRDRPIYEKDLQLVNYDRILQIAKERTANAGDFTFYFVGNFDEEVLFDYIEQYIASLPAKGKKENYKNVTERATGHVVNQFTREMETPKAIAYMMWYNSDVPYSLESSIKANMAGQVLDMVYLKKIREEASAAYSANAGGGAQMIGDKTFTQVMGYCPMKPEKGDEAVSIMRAEMQNLAKSVDPEMLAKVKEVMLKDADTNARKNGHWLDVLNTYVSRGIDVETTYKDIVNSVTPETLAKFVGDVILKQGNQVEVIMLPQE